MPDATQSLLDYLIGLFGNSDAAKSFLADPSASLAAAGLSDVCGADVNSVLPVIADFAPASVATAIGENAIANGGSVVTVGGAGAMVPADSGSAVDQLTEIVKTYTTNVNNIDNHSIDNSVSLSAGGDIRHVDLDSHAVNATGDGAVAAGGDVNGAATGAGSVAGAGNVAGATGAGAVAGSGDVNAATGAGAVAGTGDISGVNTGAGGIAGGGDVNANTGGGINSGFGSDTNANTGNGDQATQGGNLNDSGGGAQATQGGSLNSGGGDQATHGGDVNHLGGNGIQAAQGGDISGASTGGGITAGDSNHGISTGSGDAAGHNLDSSSHVDNSTHDNSLHDSLNTDNSLHDSLNTAVGSDSLNQVDHGSTVDGTVVHVDIPFVP